MLMLFTMIPVSQAINSLPKKFDIKKEMKSESTLGGGVFGISFLFGSIYPGRLYDKDGNMYHLAKWVIAISPHDGGSVYDHGGPDSKLMDVDFLSGDQIYRHAYVEEGHSVFRYIFIGHLGPFFCCGIYIVRGGVP